jgi:fucose 4-O-acetylase-like acetyltransferase
MLNSVSANGSDTTLARRGLSDGLSDSGSLPTAAETLDSEAVPRGAGGRLVYLDLLRAALVALVICHHAAVANGAQGGWYYIVPAPEGSVAPLVLTVFAAINQAFFMSLLFFVSGFFTAPAYDRKGLLPFLRGRWLRLAVPLLVCCACPNQSVEFLSRRFEGATSLGYLAFLRTRWWAELGPGPLWFVLALLAFTTLYALLRAARPGPAAPVRPRYLPAHASILAFVVGIGALTFLVRFVYPVGREFLNLQIGHFPLYVCMFALGIAAYRRAWLGQLADHTRIWGRATLASLVAMPFVLAAGGALEGNLEPFRGGPTWQSWVYCTWEAVLCVGISLWLLRSFQERFDGDGPLRARAARSAYTAYIIHPFFVVVGTWLLAALPIPVLVRFGLLGAAAVVAAFAVSDAVRRIPGVRRVV